jgi:hypothetical protein
MRALIRSLISDALMDMQAMVLRQHAHEILHAGVELGAGHIRDEADQLDPPAIAGSW